MLVPEGFVVGSEPLSLLRQTQMKTIFFPFMGPEVCFFFFAFF